MYAIAISVNGEMSYVGPYAQWPSAWEVEMARESAENDLIADGYPPGDLDLIEAEAVAMSDPRHSIPTFVVVVNPDTDQEVHRYHFETTIGTDDLMGILSGHGEYAEVHRITGVVDGEPAKVRYGSVEVGENGSVDVTIWAERDDHGDQ